MLIARKYSRGILLFGLLSGLVACGGSSDGGGYTPTLPADAARITPANASEIANSVFDSVEVLGLATSFKGAEKPPSMYELLQFVTGSVRRAGRQSASIANRTETEDCDDGGSFTANFEESATTATGSAVFSGCKSSGLTVNGSLTFNSTFDDNTGDYDDFFAGSITFVFDSQNLTLVFNLDQNGNDILGDYSTSVAFSVSGIPGGGYLVTTSKRLKGNGINIDSGRIIVQGAESTRLRIDITATNTADVDLDDGSGYANLFTCPNLTCPI